MLFDWDPKKAAANARKHRVTFDEAMTVFMEPGASGVSTNSPKVAEETLPKNPKRTSSSTRKVPV
jgi:uncharacterized DUF497 family protein